RYSRPFDALYPLKANRLRLCSEQDGVRGLMGLALRPHESTATRWAGLERIISWPSARHLFEEPIARVRDMVFERLSRTRTARYAPLPFIVGPVGSRDDYLIAFRAEDEVTVRTGCYLGTLEEFTAAIEQAYTPESTHGRQYRAAIAMVRVWASSEH